MKTENEIASEIEMTEVKSSNIKAVGFKDNNLVIEFKGNSRYLYEGVPEEIYEKILNAESVGRTFIKLVKAYKFEYTKL